MRICILTTSFPLQKGTGPGIHVLKQAQHLADLGLDVVVLAPHYSGIPHRERIAGAKVLRLRYMWPEQWQTLCYGAGIATNLKMSFWAKLQVPLLILVMLINAIKVARDCDVIHAHWPLAGLVGIFAGRFLGKPVVVMMHHAEARKPKQYSLVKFVLEHADFVLCNSSFTLAMVLKFSRPKATEVIHIGVDTKRFRPQLNTSIFYEREMDIPKDCPLIFAMGRLIEWKGFTHLIDAMTLINLEPTPFLIIGGQGPLKGSLQRYAEEKGVADRVKLLGYIPNEHTPAYYTAADLFVLPSIVGEGGDTEGLGVVLLEALACQTPCVASNVGGIPDVIIDGLNGFLVKPGNPYDLAHKIVQLIADDNLRYKMAIQGRQIVEKRFTWQAKAQQMCEIYQTLCNKEVTKEVG